MHGKSLSYYEKFVKHVFCLKEHTRTILAPISHNVTGNPAAVRRRTVTVCYVPFCRAPPIPPAPYHYYSPSKFLNVLKTVAINI